MDGGLENQTSPTLRVRGKQDFFVGQPDACDNPEVFLQLTQTGTAEWRLEAHNPTAQPMRVTVRSNPHWDGLTFEKTLDMEAGSSVFSTITP